MRFEYKSRSYMLTDDDEFYRVPRRRNDKKIHPDTHLRNYVNNNGFQTKVWGPCLWTFLHTISFNYPVSPTAQDRDHYYQFITSLCHVLPCRICRHNLSKSLRRFSKDRDLASRESFSHYIYNLHRQITRETKGSFNVPYKQICQNYSLFRANDKIHANCRTQIRVIPNSRPNKNKRTFYIHKECLKKAKS